MTVSSNVSVDVDSAQRSVHAAAETWKPPTQAWTKYQISAQAWKKTLERKMLPKGRVGQDICSKYIFYTIMLRLSHAYSEHDYAPRCTFSSLALKQFVFPRLRWNPQREGENCPLWKRRGYVVDNMWKNALLGTSDTAF